MRSVLNRWKNLSIAKKLYFVVGVMAVLIAGELLTLRFAMHTLSAVRAFVEGEGLWSKAQKDAVYKLQRYSATKSDADYEAFLDFLKIPEGDHRARMELEKPSPDLRIVREGFLAGQINPNDIDPMVELLRRFYWISYLSSAIKYWSEGDRLFFQLKEAGEHYHSLLISGSSDRRDIQDISNQIDALNKALTVVEGQFSAALGEGSRWLESIVISLLFMAVLMVESVGLTLTFVTSRMISRGLSDLIDVANRIGLGDFKRTLKVVSGDEIGQLTNAINNMGRLLLKSHSELETRVQERTIELKKAKDQLEIIFDGVADGILVQDASFQCVYSNELGAKSFLNTSISEVIKNFEIRDEHGSPFPLERLPARMALQGDRQPPETLIRVRKLESGKETWSTVKSRPVFDDSGKPYLAVSIFRDITEARRAQESQRLIAEATQVLSTSLEYETTLDQVAGLAVKVLGGWCSVDLLQDDGQIVQVAVAHTDPEKVSLAKELRRKYPPDPNATIGMPQVIRTGHASLWSDIPESAFSTAIKNPEQLKMMHELGLKSYIGVPLSIGQKIFGAITFVSTERSYDEGDFELARELGKRSALAVENARLYKASQNAIATRDEFLSIASHELKTPITSLKLQLQMARRSIESEPDPSDLPKSLVKALSLSVSQIDRITSLVEDLLDVSKIQAGKLTLNFEKVNLSELINEVSESLSEELKENSCALELKVINEAIGYWDRSRIEQVIVNLIGNSIKYAPGKPIVVTASADKHNATLSVRDFGFGIPKDKQEKIFERFERATSSRNISGLGLGLFIVKRIVTAHHGTIRVESEKEKGAVFIIELPLRPSQHNGAPR